MSMTLSRLWNSGSRPESWALQPCCTLSPEWMDKTWIRPIHKYFSPRNYIVAPKTTDKIVPNFLSTSPEWQHGLSMFYWLKSLRLYTRMLHSAALCPRVSLRAPSIRSCSVSSPFPLLSRRLKIFSKNFLRSVTKHNSGKRICHVDEIQIANVKAYAYEKRICTYLEKRTRRRMARERRGAESSVVSILEDYILKMYNRQTRRVVSRQYIANTRQ